MVFSRCQPNKAKARAGALTYRDECILGGVNASPN